MAVMPRCVACCLAALALCACVDALHVQRAAALGVGLRPPRRPASGRCGVQMMQETSLSPSLSFWTIVKGVTRCRSFHEFMTLVRQEHGDVVKVNLQPVMPPMYLLQGKKANRGSIQNIVGRVRGSVVQLQVNMPRRGEREQRQSILRAPPPPPPPPPV